MSKRVKEEERIERIIRNLLKVPENRRCINCNSLGPQYVCTTFWTFVCTNCSGVHREFTHRVKSVSMAKFNAEEVSALQAGGNERARQIYFKDWDPQRHSLPDGSNQNRLRDFIKHVYVDRKFTGERSMGKLAMVKSGAKEDSSERLSIERPSPGGRIDDRSSKYYIEERRSPRYKPDNVRSSGHRNRPVHFEIVDDRFRDDGFGSGRLSETNRVPSAESRAGSRSPYSQNSKQTTSPPEVRPVRNILGENVPPLQVDESPKAIDRRDNESSARGQKTVSLSNPDSGSLIDFSADPEPPDPAAEPQTQQSALTIYGGNGASVQSSTKAKTSDVPNINSLESILFELSAPAAGPVDIMSEAPGNAGAPSAAPVVLFNSVGANVSATTTNPPAAPGTEDAPATLPVGMVPMLPSTSIDSCAYLQSWTSSIAPNAEGSSNASDEESSQPSSKVVQDTSGVGSPAIPVEVKSSGRKELSADFFTSSYSSYPAPVPSWQIRPPHEMGFSMQYHPIAVPVPAFPNTAKSRNPFDLNDDSTQAQVPMFPSMLPVQGALPNSSAPAALLHTSETHSSQFIHPQPTPYRSMAPPQLPSYGMSLAPVSGAFTGQQLPNNMPFSRPSGGGDAFASLNPIQQPRSRYPAATTPNSFSPAGGNPFG